MAESYPLVEVKDAEGNTIVELEVYDSDPEDAPMIRVTYMRDGTRYRWSADLVEA